MSIQFIKEIKYAKLLSPLKDYQADEQAVEHRLDPLLNRETVITPGRFQYIKRLFESDEKEILNVIENTRASCPFCPERIQASTPKFPKEIVEEGKIVVGETILFPSLFAHMDYNAVGVLCKEHYLKLSEIPDKLCDGFSAGLIWLKKLHNYNRNIKYACFIENYFPPSGSTVIHPHIQVLASERPFNMLKDLIWRSRKYFENYKTNYWLDLINVELEGDRFIGEINDIVWLTPFAPMHTYEILAISRRFSNLLEVGEEYIKGLVSGIKSVLKFFQDEGLSSFNLTLYSGPFGEDSSDYFRVGLKIVGRSGYRFPFVSDLWGLQTLMMHGEAYEVPERMAERLRKYF
ncbi:MAG: hypothetical protein N3F64_03095 [Nitrososphaeria archaeon]|nr:hypothetical protein [Nitrososphaeria archaeon]